MSDTSEDQNVAKQEWIRPELRRLEAGAAESTHNANSDGGGGNQGS
jgi:hypothetical protein